MREKNGIKKDT